MIFYLAAFFWTALPIVVPDSITVIRRIDVLGTVFVGEQTVAYWFEGYSPTSLVQRGQILASAAGIFLVACAAGWMCLRWTRHRPNAHAVGAVRVCCGRGFERR